MKTVEREYIGVTEQHVELYLVTIYSPDNGGEAWMVQWVEKGEAGALTINAKSYGEASLVAQHMLRNPDFLLRFRTN